MIYNTNTQLFKKYIKTLDNFNRIYVNADDLIIQTILKYRFIKGLTWEFTALKVGYKYGDVARMTLTNYLKKKR